MKTKVTPWIMGVATILSLTWAPGFAQTPNTLTVLGQVESVDATSRTVMLKAEDGTSLRVTLADKGTVVKVAPGEKSLQNAAPIEFGGITVGDRLMVRGGALVENKIDGALRIVVMARTDLAARDEADQRAWRERAIVGTVTAVDRSRGEFTLQVSATALTRTPPQSPGAAPTPAVSLVVDAKNATLHRYSDTSVNFADAVAARVDEVAEGDQLRLLGTKSQDGSKVVAERVVFGHFTTMALSIEKVDANTGLLEVKDLQSNKKFTISIVATGTVRRIPPQMAAMFGAPSGGRAGGQRAEGGAPPAGAGRPEGGRPGAGAMPGRGNEDMLSRMPTITVADLKKNDWIGAVVGKIDSSGRAVAFNVLAGIEAFASRANRGGGVDVGMPAGLLDGGFGVQ